ncbi:DegT/DnrJ/EryC1/StrS family aminotransferase [Candidatus Woesearchaeota archaeon]|nr:DegT/DnrJ/EryC1/StrS family aminotransferase [Candidatus Woesearchaeota archaeon]
MAGKAAKEQDSEKAKQAVIDSLSKFTGHKHVRLVQRGNAAILCALYMVKKANPKPFILIPDQGGWLSFRTYPKMIGFDVRTVKTDRGLIDLIDLEKKAESGAALIVTSFAGYFAEQPMKYISKICKRYNCILIEDASGAVADDELADGYYSDIILASFGNWKPINVGYGGFISTERKEWLDDASEIFSTTNHYPVYDALADKLKGAKQRLAAMLKKAEDVKKDIEAKLPESRIVHRDLRGLNVVVSFFNEKEKQAIVSYCEANHYDYRVCPEYIRLEEDAISIELKRLDSDKKKK